MTHKIGILIFLALLLIFSTVSNGFCEAREYSDSQLKQKSDLVVRCKVIKVQASKETRDWRGFKGKISYATLEIVETLKGKASSPIVVEFIKRDDFVGDIELEPDLQDAQFRAGDEGTAYLWKLKNGHYSAVAGIGQGFKRERKVGKDEVY
jgi:hypothetical protein